MAPTIATTLNCSTKRATTTTHTRNESHVCLAEEPYDAMNVTYGSERGEAREGNSPTRRLDYLHGRTPGVSPPVLGPIVAWLVEHQVDLGSSDAPATHALVVDADSGAAWVAPIALARRIVREQSLGLEAQP